MFELVMIIHFHNLRHFLLFCFTSFTSSNIVFSLNFSGCVTENTSNSQFQEQQLANFRFFCSSFRIWALFLGTNCQFYSFRFQTLLMSKLRGMKLNRKCQKIRLRIHKSKKIGLRIHKSHLEIWISIRVLHENMFLKKRNGSTRSVIIWGWLGRNPKGFFILISFKGCTTHFRFDNF